MENHDSAIVSYIEILNEFKYKVNPHLYQAQYEKDEKQLRLHQPFIDSAELIPELPPGIPFFPETIDAKKQSKVKAAIKHIRCFFLRELSIKLKCCKDGFLNHGNQLTHIFANAFNNQMVFLMRKVKKGMWRMQLDFPKDIIWRTTCQPIDMKLDFVPNKNTSAHRQLELSDIWDNGKHYVIKSTNTTDVKKSTKRQELLALAMCAFSTQIIMKMHFLYCHLLCGQTIYNVAVQSLPFRHPVMQMMYPHGSQVNFVNLSKGSTLINECFGVDFSFPRDQLPKVFSYWMSQYKIENLYPPTLVSKILNPDEMYLSQPLEEVLKVTTILDKYVDSCLRYVYPSKKDFKQDPHIQLFLERLQELPFQSTFTKERLSVDHVKKILITWMFVVMYLHFENGDKGKELMHYAYINIPKPSDQRDQHVRNLISSEQAKLFFDLLFATVIKPTYLLQETTWLDHVPDPFLKGAKEMQSNLLTLEPNMELGINK